MPALTGFDTIVEQLLQELERAPKNAAIALPDVGRLSVKKYTPYQAPSERKYRPFFVIEGSLLGSLNQETVHFEKNAAEVDLLEFPWLAEFGAALRRSIVDQGSADVPALGRFSVETTPIRPGVEATKRTLVFTSAAELNERLTTAHSGRA